MERKLLELIPRRFLCPICGEWHQWKHSHSLGYFNPDRPAEFSDKNRYPRECAYEAYKIYVDGDYLYYSTGKLCGRAELYLSGKISIDSIKEYTDRPIVTFDVNFTSKNEVSMSICNSCLFRTECNLLKLDQGDHRHMKIPLGFEFEQSEYMQLAKVGQLARKERECQECERAQKSKELAQQRQAGQSAQQEIKEDTTMANNIFNMNMEYGPNTDENIASTLMGVAVKNGNSWRIYDKKKKEITDVGDMQLGNLPLFILPSTKLSEGDLIKDAGEYYFVTKVATPKTLTQTLSARTGEMKSVVPIKNVLGFSCYSKVIALSDSLNMGDDFDVEKLAIMSAMCGRTGEDIGLNQLLPLMLFDDELGGKLGGDDDAKKLLLMSYMMNSEEDCQMKHLLLLMLLNDKLGEGDDHTKKLLLMSFMSGGNMAGSNNLLMSYMMLDAFKDKKDDKAPQDGDGDVK